MSSSAYCNLEKSLFWDSLLDNVNPSGKHQSSGEFLIDHISASALTEFVSILHKEVVNTTSFPLRQISMDEEARTYVHAHGMASLVDKIYERVLRRFHDAEVSITVYKDPEIDDNYLQVRVRLKDYPADFIRTLEAIQCELEPGYSDIENEGYLLLTTDFSRPKV